MRAGLLLALLGSGLFLGASPALASHGSPFTVDESSVPGCCLGLPSTFTAGLLNFQYSSVGSQVIGGGDSYLGSDDPFTETGFANVTGYFADDPAHSPILTSFMGTPEILFGVGYQMWATFTISGEADFGGNTAEIAGTFLTGSLTLWVDPSQDDTGSALTGLLSDPSADDIAVGGGPLISGNSFTRLATAADPASGDFEGIFTFAVTPFGSTYFVAPSPFYFVLNFNGNTDVITGDVGCVGAPPCITFATGAGEGFFQGVPQPGTVMLLGAGLLALGLLHRRFRKA